jgi:hypothetical protein
MFLDAAAAAELSRSRGDSDMTLSPFPSEQIQDREFEALVSGICRRPGMYVAPTIYGAVCAYLDGFSTARSGGRLLGLHQWLVVRANSGNNLDWWALARQQLPVHPDDEKLPDEERAIRVLGRLLEEFFDFRRSNGITKVFHQ